MRLEHITITNFKNIRQAEIDFSPKMNCFLGNNGMGKSNLLDAVYYLSFCKSFTALPDSRLVNNGENFMMLRGLYTRHDLPEEVQVGFASGKRKSFKCKGKEYQRLSDHVGKFPLVMVAPQDIDIINSPSEERRRFLDQIISQSDSLYLSSLIRYNSCLEQRNRLLRDRIVDHTLFEAIELPMGNALEYINETRRKWVGDFIPVFNSYYAAIAGDGAETVGMDYETTFGPSEPSFAEQLASSRRRDEAVGHTSVGVHRDDLSMTIDSMPLRRTASQGQTKTFVIAMRLAQYDFLRHTTSMMPILLLDDIFDKLDAGRVERIVKIVGDDCFGQIFITDTNRDHLDSIMSSSGENYRLWHVENGKFNMI